MFRRRIEHFTPTCRRIWIAAGIVCLSVHIGCSDESAKVSKRLSHELERVAPLSGAHTVETQVFNKAGYAFATRKYKSASDWAAIQRHYDQSLGRLQWTPTGTESVKEWGISYGGKIRRYCKNDMAAEVQYAGAGRPYDWNYSLSIIWDGKGCLRR